MYRVDALAVALAMLERPQTAKLAQASRLPEGVTLLLEIAAGEVEALDAASQLTGRCEGTLQKAAGFFIEQVLLHPGGNAYRILGSGQGTPLSQLRRNMALLMRWLHPDVASDASSSNRLDRSLFAIRITQAWETIKTEERRKAYNASLVSKESQFEHGANFRTATRTLKRVRRVHPSARLNTSKKQLVMQRVEPEGFWSRLRLLLGRSR